MEKIKEILGDETTIGKPVDLGGGVSAVPIFKVNFAFGTGGTDLAKRADGFGGGIAGGAKVTPIAFLVNSNGAVRVIPVDSQPSTVDNIVQTVPQVVDQITALFNKDKSGE